MATKIKFEHNSAGWREILHSAGVRALVDDTGLKYAAAMGDGYEYFPAELNYGGGRAGGYIHTTTIEAMEDEAENKTMERTVGDG